MYVRLFRSLSFLFFFFFFFLRTHDAKDCNTELIKYSLLLFVETIVNALLPRVQFATGSSK